MADLTRQTIGTDPTEGLVLYTKAVKPYHTKILDVLVEYVYAEDIKVTVRERWDWTLNLTRPNIDTIRTCGYGVIWDDFYTQMDQPIAKIKQAMGNVPRNVAPISVTFRNNPDDSTEVLVVSNPDNYNISLNDPITFQTTDTYGVLPTISSGIVSPGRIYYVVSINGDVLKVSTAPNGPAISFLSAGIGPIGIRIEKLDYNTFLIEKEQVKKYKCIITDLFANQLTFVSNYTIVDISASTKTITISGLHFTNGDIVIGDVIFVRDNTDPVTNGDYTVVSVVEVDGNTQVVVDEAISMLAGSNGSLNVTFNPSVVDLYDNAFKPSHNVLMPRWTTGTAVKLSKENVDVFASPLNNIDTYYFIPTNTIGTFNLSKNPNMNEYADIVDITTLGSGVFDIERIQLFMTGDIVEVSGSTSLGNNGSYYIQKVVDEGNYLRIYPAQSIPQTTPIGSIWDGMMKMTSGGGYDVSFPCALLQSPDLYADTYINERITFEFVMRFNEDITSQVTENDGGISHSSSEFISTTSTILPTGFDTQLFDVGSIDEDYHLLSHNAQ